MLARSAGHRVVPTTTKQKQQAESAAAGRCFSIYWTLSSQCCCPTHSPLLRTDTPQCNDGSCKCDPLQTPLTAVLIRYLTGSLRDPELLNISHELSLVLFSRELVSLDRYVKKSKSLVFICSPWTSTVVKLMHPAVVG